MRPHACRKDTTRQRSLVSIRPRAFVTHLPHAHDGVCDEDEEDDEGLDEGGDGFLTFLKHGQHLRESKR